MELFCQWEQNVIDEVFFYYTCLSTRYFDGCASIPNILLRRVNYLSRARFRYDICDLERLNGYSLILLHVDSVVFTTYNSNHYSII